MKTEITKIKGDWIEVASDCRSTVGKPPLDHEPSTEFKRKILIAEHSPIRDISVKWTWHGIKSWVATTGAGISSRSTSSLSAQTEPASRAINCRRTRLLTLQVTQTFRH